jgi:hypothetical protein
MLKLLHRHIAAVDSRLVLLAPPTAELPAAFENVTVDAAYHGSLLRDMQRLRGGIYLRDGAVEPQQLTSDGLHQTPEDSASWHLLMLDKSGGVDACIWYREHDPATSVDALRVRHCPLAGEPASRSLLWNAVEHELAAARADGLGYAEIGGWAVSEPNRRGPEGLVLALAGYSLGRALGGALGLTTATVRHCSSTILRRLGGSDLRSGSQTVPSYYDPKYKCEMELLRFDSRRPNARYEGLVAALKDKMSSVLVLAPHAQPSAPVYNFFRHMGAFEQVLPAAS